MFDHKRKKKFSRHFGAIKPEIFGTLRTFSDSSYKQVIIVKKREEFIISNHLWTNGYVISCRLFEENCPTLGLANHRVRAELQTLEIDYCRNCRDSS